MNSIVRCPRTGRACSEGACRERHWCRQLFERGLSHRGLPLKRKFRPRCCAKTRAGAPCIMRVVPGKRRCRFHGGMSTGPRTKPGRARIAEAQRRRWFSVTQILGFATISGNLGVELVQLDAGGCHARTLTHRFWCIGTRGISRRQIRISHGRQARCG